MAGDDLEAGLPPKEKSWRWSWASASIASWPIEFMSGSDSASRNTEESIALNDMNDTLTTDQLGLLSSLEIRDECPSLLIARKWYIKYIEHRFQHFWALIQPIVHDDVSNNATPDHPAAYDLLRHVALHALKSHTSLDECVENLVRHRRFQNPAPSLYQTLFIFLGWLSMIYEPRQDPDEFRLQLAETAYESNGRISRLESIAIKTHSLDQSSTDQPMYITLSGFGDLIPDISLRNQHNAALESIQASWISYQALIQVLGISIIWTDTINLHLEFDESSKILKLLRCPSIAVLHYKRQKKQHTFLSRMFEDSARNLISNTPGRSIPENGTSDYFRELLKTYRLLFGQDKKSTKYFRKEMCRLPKSIMDLPDSDPLLAQLCGTHYASLGQNNIYDEIKAGTVTDIYSASEFPHFGGRLLALQKYSRDQKPRSPKALWFDGRDQGNWWQVWAMMFGAAALLCAFLALLVQIWQVVLAQLQWSNSFAAIPQPSSISFR